MQRFLRVLITILVLLAAGVYLLERYALIGPELVDSDVTISEINPHPTITIPIREEGGFVRVYLKARGDVDLDITVRGPGGSVLLETSRQIGRYNFRFPTATPGDYSVVLATTPPDANLVIKAYRNDRRIASPFYL